MELENKQRIQQKEVYLRENLGIDDILSNLLHSVINQDDEERIKNEVTQSDKVWKFLRILERKPPGSYGKFCSVLEKRHQFIKDELDGCVIDEEDLQRRRQSIDDCIKEFLNENYIEEQKEKVSVGTLIDNLQEHFTRNGESAFPENEHIIRIVQSNYKEVIKKKDKKKKEFVFYNLKRVLRTAESDEDVAEETFVKTVETKHDLISSRKSEEGPIKVLNRKRMEKMTTIELCKLLQPKLHQYSIDETLVLKNLKEENVVGKAFMHLDSTDVKELFPSLKFGDRKLIRVIRDELIAEEGALASENESDDDLQGYPEKDSSYERLTDIKPRFRETFRKFGHIGKVTDTYRKDAVVNTNNTRISDLIEPVHRFMYLNDTSNPSTPDWIAEETIIFASACLNERTNGTLHFGICGEKSETHDEGQIVGIHVDRSICQEHLNKMIRKMFYDDQLDVAFKCIRSPQFVDVFEHGDRSQALTVVEIDVVPAYELIKDEAIYIKTPHQIKRNENKVCLFRFENGTSNPVLLSDEEIRNYMMNKTKLSEHRKRQEQEPINNQIKEDLRTKFLNLFTGGDDVLSHEIYPVLFLSPIDSSMSQEFIDENFKFLVDIDANAIFDFDPSSDKSGMFNFVEHSQEQVVKAFTTENFDRNSDENREKKDKYSSMLDDLRISSVKPWIFCNGYEAMDKEPLLTLEWKQKRSEGFKEALRFFRDEIPNERAFVLFLLFSKNYEIMLEAADEVLVKFKDQWMVIAPSEDIVHSWSDELVRRQMTDKKSVEERSVIGMPWQHVNKMISDAVMPVGNTRCEIITSTGAYCTLRKKVKNELFDIEVVSRKECEDSDIVSDVSKREKHRREVEECFFKGGEVTWWNMWFRQDHVLQRSQHQKLIKMVISALKGEDMEEDSKVGVVNLFHQPGAGGTTSAKQILWDLKDEYRCCVIKQLSEETCEQITALRNYEDPEFPKPPLVLIDNGDEEKIQSLHTRLEDRAWVASRRNQMQVFCVLLLCTRRTNLPMKINKRSISLKHELDDQELEWFKRKNEALEKHFKSSSDGCDPRLLISFNILKENFNEDYIKRAVEQFVDGVASEDEQRLLKYLSLLNTYDVDFNSVPLSAFDPLMQNVYKNRKCIYSFGLVPLRPSPRQSWETRISSSLQILLNRTSRAGLGSQLKALSIINSLFAREILLFLQNKLKHSTSEIMQEFLNSVVFKVNNQSQNQLLGIVKDIMKKREVQESGMKDKFSRLITYVLEHEDPDTAAQILIKGFEMSNDPMIAQQISRLYIHSKNWDKAIQYANKATSMRPQNSYLWDTFAQIYKRQLLEKYTNCVRAGERMSNEEIVGIVRIAFEGIRNFQKEQEVSSFEKTTHPNDAGYFGELKIIILMLDLIKLCPSIPKDVLHRFLVDRDSFPGQLRFLDRDTMYALKSLYSSTEHTMRTLEEKKTQVKEDVISGVFQSKPRFKDNLKELANIKENLDQYFGEDTDEIPANMKPEDIPLFIRRRVRRLGGRSLPSILDIARNDGGEEKLHTIYKLLETNVNSKFIDAYDIVTLIGVALVMNIKCGVKMDFNRFIDWSRRSYDLISSNDERPYLESFLYLVMFNWPTEKRGNSNLCPTGCIVDAIKKWRIAFQAKHPRQDGKSVQKKETTYFFLGNGSGMEGIVYYEQLIPEHRGRYYKGDTIWRLPHVLSKLKRLTGTLVTEGLEIAVQVETGGGNKSIIYIPTSLPIGKRSLWQKRVFFVLGFGWAGTKAYDVSQEDPTKKTSDNQNRLHTMTFRSQNSQREIQRVKTHEDLSTKLEAINKELEQIKKFKSEKLSQKESQANQQRESHLRKQRDQLIQQRGEFLRN